MKVVFNRAQAATLLSTAMLHSRNSAIEVTDTNSEGAIGIKVSDFEFADTSFYRLHKSGGAEKIFEAVSIVEVPDDELAAEEDKAL
jgi:hypothetical protein